MEIKKYKQMMAHLTRPGRTKPKKNISPKQLTLPGMDVPQTQLKPLIDLEKEMEKYDDDDIPIQVLKNSPNNVVEKRGKQTEALINTTNKHLKDQIKKGNIKKEDLLLRQDPNGLMVNKNRTIAIRDSFMAKQFNNALGVNDEPMATPEQVGKLAERLERNAQMTGGKGPLSNFKKKPIKKKTEVNYSDFKINPTLPTEFFKPTPPSPEYLEQKRKFERILAEREREKASRPKGLPGILGLSKKDYE